MDLLGPSLEDMSWRVAAGGPLSRLTTLMVCDQALERIHAVHEAGYVSICIFTLNLTGDWTDGVFCSTLYTGTYIATSSPIIYSWAWVKEVAGRSTSWTLGSPLRVHRAWRV
jgi:hypothetical protein